MQTTDKNFEMLKKAYVQASNNVLWSFPEAASFICFIAVVHKRNSSTFFSFLCRHHLTDILHPTNYFSLFHIEFPESLAYFHQHGTLFSLPMRATSHLTSFSRRNFGTRFFKYRENTGNCGNGPFQANSLSVTFHSRCQRTGPLSQKDSQPFFPE